MPQWGQQGMTRKRWESWGLLLLVAVICLPQILQWIYQSSEAAVLQEAPRIALTFDDGPSSYTMELSQGLKERHVPATFFVIGQNVEQYEKSVRQLAADGHLLGNHTYHHIQLGHSSGEIVAEEIAKTNNLLYELTGVYPIYIRPPFGEWNSNLDVGIDMIPVLWTVDSLDWKLQDAAKITKRVLDEVEEGDIILMHDGYASSVEAVWQIVDSLQARGFEFVTVDQLLVEY